MYLLQKDHPRYGWTEKQIMQAWTRARPVPGYDGTLFRRDVCGAWIKFSEYGMKEGSEHGWQILSALSTTTGSRSRSVNLKPLHWLNFHHKETGLRDNCGDCLITEF